jgi:hypothetical protein
MRKLVMRIIVIELFSAGGCPLEEASEHCFFEERYYFWYFSSQYFIVPLIFVEYSCCCILYYIWYLTSGIKALSLVRIVG